MTSFADAQRPITHDRRGRRPTARRARGGASVASTRAVCAVSFLAVLALGAGWLWALAAAAATGAVCSLALRHRRRIVSFLRPRKTGAALPGLGAAPAGARRAITDARATITRMRAAAAGIGDARVRAKAVALCDTAERVLGELQRKPAGVARARRFLCYYLEAAQRIVARYVQLGGRGGAMAEVGATLDKVEPALDVMASVFAAQLAHLQRDDALDLDAELSLLETTARFGGLLDDPFGSSSGASHGR